MHASHSCNPSTQRHTRVLVACIALMLAWTTLSVGDDAAELVKLRRELAGKDAVIADLKAKLGETLVKPVATMDDRAAKLNSLLPQAEAPPADPVTVPSIPVVPDRPNLDPAPSTLFDNLNFFAGPDGSKQPQDFGVNALFGGRVHFDWGIPLIKERGIGLQIGSAMNFSPNAVQVIDRIQGTKRRTQNFTSLGLFQRTDWGLNWGVGYDLLYEQYFDHFHIGQWRGHFGYELSASNEVGANLMLRSYGSSGYFGKTPVTLHSINMANLFVRHTFKSGASGTIWAGIADGHNEPNAALGDAGPVRHPFVYGAQVDVPLNEHLAMFGQANFILPPSTGTVDAFLGIVYHPVGLSIRERSKRLRPVMAVANNPTFGVDLGRK